MTQETNDAPVTVEQQARLALESMMRATDDGALPIIRRLARIQARHALAALASAPAGDHIPDAGKMIAPAGDGVPAWHGEAFHNALLASSAPVERTELGDLPSRIQGWIGKARARGGDRIELDFATVELLVSAALALQRNK